MTLPLLVEAWLAQHRRELKAVRPANLIKVLSEVDFKTIRGREAVVDVICGGDRS